MRKILTVIFTVAFLSASAQAPAGQTVDIESDISGIVYGNSTTTKLGFSKGNSNNTDPNGNIVNTNGHRVSGSIYGGKFRTSNNDDNVNGNTVNISGESGEFGDWIYGGYAMLGEACNNTLNISGGKFTYWVVGSYSLDGKAAGNTVNIIGGSFDSIIYGGYSISGETAGNRVSISDGSFAGNIYGGYSISGKASSNTVDISGGVFKSGIYGGSGSGQVTDNTVNISGSPNLIEASLFGANKDPGYSANNTLNLYSQITVKEMRYFQNLNFYLPATYSGSGAMLTVNGKAYIDEATVGIEINGASSPLRAGDKITLIKAEELSGTPKKDDRRATGFQGFTLQYEFDISVENGSLFATVTADDPGTGGSGDSGGSEETGGLDNSGDPGDTGNSGDSGNTGDPGDSGVSRDTDDTGRPRTGGKGGVTVTSRSKALSEGLIANVTAINSGGDLLSGAGIMKTPRSVNSESGSYASGVTSFGKSRYNTGSHVDSDTLAVLAGIRFAEIRRGRTAVSCGVFTEAGWSDYDTFNDFANAPDVRGNGESNYFGGGLMLRADYGGNGSGWFYNDAAIRFGRARNSFACDGGMPVNYKTDSPYYGGHIGLGYVRELKNGARLDIGTKLLWTRLEGDSVTLPTKDPITFAKSDSLRARVGARYDAEKFYAGVAYEYEFAGEANATAYGFPIPAPSLKGGTGICELGFTLGKKNAPFSADFNLSGFTGKREGFAGGINLNWKF